MRNVKRQPAPLTKQEIVALTLFLLGFCGIPGGFVGAMAIPEFANRFFGLECLWWQGLIIGLVLGMAAGALNIFFASKKRATSDRARSKTLSLKDPNLGNEKSTADSIRLLLGSSGTIWFDLAGQKQVKNSTVSLGEFTITHYSDSERRSSRTVAQSVVVFEDPDLNLPEFALRPNKNTPSLLANLFSGAGPSMEEFPEFSSRYQLVGLERRLKQLFTSDLVALLTRQPIWEIHASKSRMILFVPQQVFEGENRDRFFRRAMKIAQFFEQRCIALKENHDFNQPVGPQEIKTQVEKIGGPLGILFQQDFKKKFISRDEVREFISQGRPRVIPKPLRHQTSPDYLLLYFSFLLILVGLMLILISQTQPEHMFQMHLWAFGAFLASGLFLFLATFSSRRKRALLKNGLATPGEITKVESTGWVNGNKKMYRCHVQFSHGGTKRAATCWIDQILAKRARAIIDEQRSTQILTSPSNPKRCLVPELMAMA